MRVWYLQILKGDLFENQSEHNRVRFVSLPSFRGMILDRNGLVLASIRPSFNLYITREDAQDLEGTLAKLKTRVKFDSKVLKDQMRESAPFKPVLVKADVSREVVAFLEENNRLLPGIQIKVEPMREYLYDHLASHIMGYVSEITESKLRNSDSGYMLGDMVGQYGLELLLENDLTGKKGYKEIEVDVAGRQLKTLRRLPPESGKNIILTLDLKLQQAVDRLMTGTKENPIVGSAVVLDVQTGEILALVSKPDFDPNLFAAGISHKQWDKMHSDPFHPLQNRAINGVYPPASIYKIIAAYAGLEEGLITSETQFNCPGYLKVGKRSRFRCWKRSGHGELTVKEALMHSCDVFFYNLGYKLGVDTLGRYARLMGFGEHTRVNLMGERPGLVPTMKWKEDMYKIPWQPGDTIAASIGQGYNLVTPLQQARLISLVANGGRLFKPYIVRQTQDKENLVIKRMKPELVRQLQPKSNAWALIREALMDVVNHKEGTGRGARSKGVVIAGKTGTAQVVALKALKKYKEKKDIPFQFRDHSWFAGYAPYEKPQIGVAVIIEHGGSGGKVAAPLVRHIIEAYDKIYPFQQKSVQDGMPPGKTKPEALSTAPPQGA